MKQRLFSILLILALLMTLVPVGAFAEGEPAVVTEETEAQTTPTPEPTAEPTQEPTQTPTSEPTALPTPEPTAEPIPEPASEPVQESVEETAPAVPAEPAEGDSDKVAAQEPEDVKVVFIFTPAEVKVELSVYTKDENGNKEKIRPEKDESFLLTPGRYYYALSAEGYEPVEGKDFEVRASDQPLEVHIVLESVEPEPTEETDAPEEKEATEAQEPEAAEEAETEEEETEEEETPEEEPALSEETMPAEESESKDAFEQRGAANTAAGAVITPISPGTITVTIADPNDTIVYSFTPAESGNYVFMSSCENLASYAVLTESQNSDDTLYDSRDWGTGDNFNVRYELEAGKTYYYTVGLKGTQTGSYTVTLSRMQGRFSSAWAAGQVGVTYTNYPVHRAGSVNIYGYPTVDTDAAQWEYVRYQWYKDGVMLDGEDDPGISIISLDDTGTYTCRVTDDLGTECEVTFVVYEFSVGVAGSDCSNLSGTYEVPVGEENYTIAVEVTPEQDVTYEWRERDTGTTVGGNSPDFTIPSVTQSFRYDCTVTNSRGDWQTVSFDVNVSNDFRAFVAGSSDEAASAEYELNNAEDYTLAVDVRAADKTGISYEWRIFDGSEERVIDGADGPSCQIRVHGPEEYRCIVTDRYGTINTVTFVIIAPPYEGFFAFANESNVSAVFGQSAWLEVEVMYFYSVSVDFRWVQVIEDGNGTSEIDIPDYSDRSLSTDPVTEDRHYRCYVSDEYEVQVVDFDVHPMEPDELTVWAVGYENMSISWISIPAGLNDDVTLRVGARAPEGRVISYSWYNENTNEPIDNRTDTLELTSLDTQACRRCHVSDDTGEYRDVIFFVYIDTGFHVNIKGTTLQSMYCYVEENSDLMLEVEATSNEPDKITYSWVQMFSNYGNAIDGATGSTLVLKNITGNADYYCSLYDGYGNYESCWFYIRIGGLSAHVKDTQLTETAAETYRGKNVTLEVEWSCGGPFRPEQLEYEWKRINGQQEQILEGGTIDALTVNVSEDIDIVYTLRALDGENSSKCSVVFHIAAIDAVTEDLNGLEYALYDSTATITGFSSDLGSNVVIPDRIGDVSVTEIADNAFEGCATLTSVSIPSTVRTIGDYAFAGCTSLVSVVIRDSGESIVITRKSRSRTPATDAATVGEGAFSGCTSLRSVELPEGTGAIMADTFADCANLTSVEIPASVTSIGSNAFANTGLTHVTIPEEVETIGSGAFANTALTQVTIPESVTVIAENTFSGCSELTSVTIPEGVETIGSGAFANTGLTEITIPGSVTSIETGAFQGADITSVNYAGTDEQWAAVNEDEQLENAEVTTEYVDNHFSAADGETGLANVNRTVRSGSDVTMTVRVTRDDAEDTEHPTTYKWYGDGVEIEGADTASFTVREIKAGGVYSCLAEDGLGRSATVSYTLTIALTPGGSTDFEDIFTGSNEVRTNRFYRFIPDSTGYYLIAADRPEAYVSFSEGPIGGLSADGIRNSLFSLTGGTAYWLNTDQDVDMYDSAFNVTLTKVTNLAAVSFTQKPESSEVSAGDAVLFEVGVLAADPSWLRYEWTLNGEPIEGAAGTRCMARPMKGIYACTVSDGTVTKTVSFEITEIYNNLSVYVNGKYRVQPGSTTVLLAEVWAEDTDGVIYAWYKDGQQISGNSAELTTDPVTEAATYKCVVTDRFGNTAEGETVIYPDSGLSVRPAGALTYYAQVGDTVALEVRASTNIGGVTYRWYDPTGITLSDTSVLTVSDVQGDSEYWCQVTDQFGYNRTVRYTVLIDNGFESELVGALAYDDYSARITVSYGDPAELEVRATSYDPENIRFQWYLNGEQIEGATQGRYTTPPIVRSDLYYTCLVTDGHGGEAEYTVYFEVDTGLEAVAAGTDSSSQAFVLPDGTRELTLSVEASSLAGPMNYTWSAEAGGSYRELSGEGPSCTVMFTEEFPLEEMTVRCNVYDAAGNNDSVKFCIIPEPAQETILEYTPGSPVTVDFEKNGTIFLYFTPDEDGEYIFKNEDHYNSFYCGFLLFDGEFRKLDTFYTYTPTEIFSCNLEKGKVYYLGITADQSPGAAVVSIRKHVDNHLTALPVGDYVRLRQGEQATLKVRVTADDMEGITYQWWYQYCNDSDGQGLIPVEGAAGDTCVTVPFTKNADYECLVSDAYGNAARIWFIVVSAAASDLTVNGGTVSGTGVEFEQLSASLVKATVPYGSTPTLKVDASASEPIAYHWYLSPYDNKGNDTREWFSLSNENGSTLTADPVCGHVVYRCYISDSAGVDDYGGPVEFDISIDNGLWAYEHDSHKTDIEVRAAYGDQVTLRIDAGTKNEEDHPLKYQWYKNEYLAVWDTPIKNKIVSTTETGYTIDSVVSSGEYGCDVTDSFGDTVTVTFRVVVENEFKATAAGTDSTQTELYAADGEILTLTVDAAAKDGNLRYRWCKFPFAGWTPDFDPDPASSFFLPGNEIKTYPVTDDCIYICYVTDKYETTIPIVFNIRAAVPMSLSNTELTLAAGRSETIQVIGAEGTVTWTAENRWSARIGEDVVRVVNGKITGLSAGVATVTASCNGRSVSAEVTVLFTDVAKQGDYFYAPVYWAAANGITTGTSASTFSPNASCTRGQIVTFLWRAMGEPQPLSTKNPFIDVKASDYYYLPVLWAYYAGITTGTSATTFSPNGACTRKQIVTFLWRAQGSPEPTSAKNPFKDVKPSDYFYDAVLWAVENGITTGTSATTFAPNAACSRGQCVTFLMRAVGSPEP